MGSVVLRADNYVFMYSLVSVLYSANSHIDMICCEALKNLGFVMRSTKVFSLNNTIKTSYPISEYGSLIWDPYT